MTADLYGGLTVLEVGTSVASAFCGKLFADLGADVRITSDAPRFVDAPPLVDGVSQLAVYLDEGKSIGGGDVRGVDIVLVAEGIACIPSDAVTEQTVVLEFSAFGEVGPYAGWKSSELVLQAVTGVLDLVGEPGGTPTALGGHQIEYSQGWMAFTGASAALFEREASGLGQRVATTGYGAGAYLEWKGRTYEQVGMTLTRGERSGPIIVPASDGPFGLFYRNSDWPQVVAGLDAPELGRPPFDSHAGRVRNAEEFRAAVAEITSRFTRAELTARLQRLRVPVAPVLDAVDLLESPQYAHRGFIDAGVGYAGRMPLFPAIVNGERPRSRDHRDTTRPSIN